MDGLEWKTLLKWMIWGYHYFWKHPNIWYFHPENWGNKSHFDVYFSDGLKPPTGNAEHIRFVPHPTHSRDCQQPGARTPDQSLKDVGKNLAFCLLYGTNPKVQKWLSNMAITKPFWVRGQFCERHVTWPLGCDSVTSWRVGESVFFSAPEIGRVMKHWVWTLER